MSQKRPLVLSECEIVEVAQLSHVTAALSISGECLLYSCVCAAVQQSDRVCVVRVGLRIDSLCSFCFCILLCAAAMPLEQPHLLVPKELTFPEEAKLPE